MRGLVVFVCSGNICRSPMAEYLARAAVPDRSFASAGTSSLPGARPSPKAAAVMAEIGIDLSAHRARSVWDLREPPARLLAATAAHVDELIRRRPDWAPRIETIDPDGADIDDPFGRDLAFYRRTRRSIAAAIGARFN